jgi:hypothetical protein
LPFISVPVAGVLLSLMICHSGVSALDCRALAGRSRLRTTLPGFGLVNRLFGRPARRDDGNGARTLFPRQ